jgi:UDP-N-acetylglucosamine--N-acetylmuramyl-(pentapeptide) pyrophosphoryl-undecaprenol N-acetylglucosamine transferase
MTKPCALIMAGGTGGHIFPALALAQALEKSGWHIVWLGTANGMEHQQAKRHGLAFEAIEFSGVRGKGLLRWLKMPLELVRALLQAKRIVKRHRPQVCVGFGGYVTVPGGLAAWLSRVPLLIHEQNAIAGMGNRCLSALARQSFTAFPNALKDARCVGNPLRDAFVQQATPRQRLQGRSGPLHLLVVGGSLGAAALNTLVPQALALLPEGQRPVVVHQCGEKSQLSVAQHYASLGVVAQVVPFIDDPATAYAQADVLICRAGASTVMELAAIGVAALYVPFPHAVDDHQTANARYITEAGGGWLRPQQQLDATALAQWLSSLSRAQLIQVAEFAHAKRQLGAVQAMTQLCEELRA